MIHVEFFLLIARNVNEVGMALMKINVRPDGGIRK